MKKFIKQKKTRILNYSHIQIKMIYLITINKEITKMKKQDIFELISYGLKKDDDNYRKKVKYIMEEEKTENHIANVNYLEKLLDTRLTRQNNGYFDNSINENMVKDIIYTKTPVKT